MASRARSVDRHNSLRAKELSKPRVFLAAASWAGIEPAGSRAGCYLPEYM
jgi:hypothetical protein